MLDSDVLLISFVITFLVLIFVVGPISFGVLFSGGLRSRRTISKVLVVVTSLLVAVDAFYRVVFDLGGAWYTRHAAWISPVWVLLGLAWLFCLGLAVGKAVSHWRGDRLRALSPLIVFVAGVLVLRGMSSVSAKFSTHSDTVMIGHFRSRESEFNRLGEMFAQDERIYTICEPERAQQDLSPERLSEYGALLQSADVRYGITREHRGQIWLRYWVINASTLVDQHVEKGYAFIDGPPGTIMDSLDDPRSLGEGVAYRHITGRWYLYYQNRDSVPGVCK